MNVSVFTICQLLWFRQLYSQNTVFGYKCLSLCQLFLGKWGEQHQSDYWVGNKLESWWLGINFLLLVIFQSSLIDLKEHASSLASAGLKRDSKLKSLEIAIEQKKEECSKLEAQLKKVSSILKTNKIQL